MEAGRVKPPFEPDPHAVYAKVKTISDPHAVYATVKTYAKNHISPVRSVRQGRNQMRPAKMKMLTIHAKVKPKWFPNVKELEKWVWKSKV